MTPLALALVGGSAVLHATWNLLAKRARGGAEFVWLFAAMTVVIHGPLVAVYVLIAKPSFTWAHAGLALGSGVLHVFYFISLQRGYRMADLSLVYPTARGSGPALATLLAVLLLGERPGPQALVGTALVVLSVFVLAGGRGGPGARAGLRYGLITGLFIGSYTVFDGYAVGHAGAAPVVFTYAGEVARTLLLAPLVAKRRPELARAWRENRLQALGIAVLSPTAYLMVLLAMTFTPVSLVAPTREVSILLGTLLGARLLAEGEVKRRMVGAAGMVLGVTLLALA